MAHQAICGCNSAVECHLAKVKVASPNLVTRSKFALVAQLDRASDYESEGCRFNSCWAHQFDSKCQIADSKLAKRNLESFSAKHPADDKYVGLIKVSRTPAGRTYEAITNCL